MMIIDEAEWLLQGIYDTIVLFCMFDTYINFKWLYNESFIHLTSIS